MTFWSDKTWRLLPKNKKPVEPFDSNLLEEAKYPLSIGDEVYVSSPEGKPVQTLQPDRSSFVVEPGQFAFLLTAEEVTIPFNAIGFISIKTGIKFMGLVNISGFHVDPGYSGKLIFAVFNAGPSKIHMKKGDQVFSLWMANLDEAISKPKVKLGYQHIESRLVNQISGEFPTAYQVKKELDDIRSDVTHLKAFRLYLLAVIGLLVLVFSTSIRDKLLSLNSEIASVFKTSTPALPPAASTNSPTTDKPTQTPSSEEKN